MRETRPELDWIDRQPDRMLDRVQKWASIPSGTYHRGGLARMAEELSQAFGEIADTCEFIDLPPMEAVGSDGQLAEVPLGQALLLTRRPTASRRVLLSNHMDTIHRGDLQLVEPRLEQDKLFGPGVADAKGGLAVMLTALEAIEQSDQADDLGWEVLINPDEEIGSPGSVGLLHEAGQRNDLGLVFEPTMLDGSLVSERGGSGNFALVVHGRAAHVGREFESGRSAISALTELIGKLESLNDEDAGVTVNVGQLEGGTAPNLVPDLAIARFNIRYSEPGQQQAVRDRLESIVETFSERDGILAQLHGGVTAPVKPLDGPTRQLLDHVVGCGSKLGLDLAQRATRGVCDGNRFAAAGLPTLDTLGVRGGGMHTVGEYMLVDSLTERAKLTTLLLSKLAAGELAWPARDHAHAVSDAPA